MARYFFHTRTLRVLQHDDEGLELPDVDAAQTAAVRLLRELTKRLEGDDQAVELYVESDTGEMLVTGSLSLRRVARGATARQQSDFPPVLLRGTA